MITIAFRNVQGTRNRRDLCERLATHAPGLVAIWQLIQHQWRTTFGELFHGYAQMLKHRQMEIGHRRILPITKSPALRDRALATSQQDGQVLFSVLVAVRKAGSIDDHRLIKQRSILVLNTFQSPQKVRGLLRVPLRHAVVHHPFFVTR